MQPVTCLLRKFPPGAYRTPELETFISSPLFSATDPRLLALKNFLNLPMHTARIPPVDPAPATITAVLAMHAGHMRMQEPPLTASTCFRSPSIASRRSIQRMAESSPPSPLPALAATRGSRGLKGHSGSEITEIERSIRLIPRQVRFFVQSNPTASSPGSLGSMESFGTPLGRVRRAT